MTESSAPEKCTPASEMTDDEFAAEFRTWLDANLVGEFAEIKGVGGPGSEHEFFPQRLAWERHMAAAGWTCVGWPVEHGGRGASLSQQVRFHEEYAKADAPARVSHLGETLLGPTLIAHGTREQKDRFLPRIIDVTELWAQGYSEPGAGSDLANVSTAAELGDDGRWHLNGQKVWTSLAHHARWAIFIARTDPDVPKHQGITYFICDMTAPGVEVRPLRQITGEAEFNEVFLTEVRISDEMRLGPVGGGWRVAQSTLMNERVSIGGDAVPREGGPIGVLAGLWRQRPELRTSGLYEELLRLWVEAEAVRLTGVRLRQQLVAGDPGPEGSAVKLSFASLNQRISGLELELLGQDGLCHTGWSVPRPDDTDFLSRPASYRYLRAKGNSIEGGTSEILRNIIAERVLGLPGEPRVDKDIAWKDLPK